ncbi:MAG: hypothetical protein K2O40_15775 [Lachnospiraceae bacterium]|nr:hypothetical protein [Lachnospiraceae bacterium]
MNTNTYKKETGHIPALIRLGIAMDYQVKWGMRRILRDFVQNFYDSIGAERFGDEFEYKWEIVEEDIENAVMEIVSELEGEALRKVFLAFEPHWNKSGKRDAYGPDWGRLIRRTVYELCDDPVSGQCIREYLTGKYIADMDFYTIRQNRNKYGTAVTWFRTSKFHGTYKLLPFYFSEFGIDTIYSLCEKHDGFHIIHVPNELERNRIGILERMARDIFPDMLVYEKLPECRVIVNRGTPNTGLARTEDGVVPARNGIGLKAVSEIREISLRKELFCCDAFPEAMVVYMHELLHQFGGDASRQFRTAILAMDYRIIKEARRLETYEREWAELG